MEDDSNENDVSNLISKNVTLDIPLENIIKEKLDSYNCTYAAPMESETPLDLREQIIDHVARTSGIHLKSQQIGEPELSFNEKRNIVEDVMNRSYATFLCRFGVHLLPEHLAFFDNPPECESYEVHFYVNKLKSTKCKPATKVQIKNRRFEAMKRLMSEGEYFSVGEMRKRNPLLFDQLLGNFLKNPETKINDEKHTIAHILLEQIEQDQVAALKQSQMEAEMKQAEEMSSSDEDYIEGKNGTHTSHCVKEESSPILWGKSDKREHVIGKTRWKHKHALKIKSKESDLTHEEKVLLINEFTSSMFNNFLQGKDEFDYSNIDNNPEYDDVNQCDVDEEEKYFDSESPAEIVDKGSSKAEDDELDAFMKTVEDEVTSENLADRIKEMAPSKAV